MEKIHESICKPVDNPVIMARELNELAREKKAGGYQIERGVAGAVIVKLDDGEIHFVPAAGCIKLVAFAY